ncbi:MAG: BTAD domain-containing putative transcriptional regulator [Acidiferrobacterales bacterium]
MPAMMTNSGTVLRVDPGRDLLTPYERTPEEAKTKKNVEVFTLGRFQLKVQGKTISDCCTAQTKPLEVMKAIIAMGGHAVRTERILDALWPDAEADAAHHALETALYRLRKILGVKQALILQDGRLRFDSDYCWIDVWYFERLLEEAEIAVEDEASLGVIEILAAKLKLLYQGPFLHDSPEQYWLLSSRERIHYRLLSVLGSMGRLCEKKQSPVQAIDLYQRVIALNPLAEESYQDLMLCLKRLGRRAEAVAVYQRCRKNLVSALNIEPSAETEAIVKSL